MDDLLLMKGLTQEEQLMMMNEMSRRQKKPTTAVLFCLVIVYRSGLTKGTGVLSGARRIDVTMSITRIPL